MTQPNTQLTNRDLIIGQPVSFRPVVVRIRFPDGAPMSWAVVRATGDAPEGDLPWTFSQVASVNGKGVVRFKAPANRKLRIEVRDWYGRDLKKAYIATYEVGLEPIEREFVVEP